MEAVTLDLPNTAHEAQERAMQGRLLGNRIKLLDNHTGVPFVVCVIASIEL